MLDETLFDNVLTICYGDSGDPGNAALERRAAQLARQGEYIDAARLAQRVLRSGAGTIDTVVQHLLGVLLQDGIAALPAVLRRLCEALDRSFPEGTLPPPRAQKKLDSALTWLWQTLGAQIAFHKAKRDEVWQRWVMGCDDGMPVAHARWSAELKKRIAALVEAPRSTARLESLDSALEGSLYRLIATRDDDEDALETPVGLESPAVEFETPAPPSSDEERELLLESLTPWHDADVEPPERGMPPSRGEGPRSALMIALERKLDVFQQLVDEGDLARAAIVAMDIEQIRQSFDPVLYLPALFGPYLEALCQVGDELMDYAVSDSLSRQALQKLYETDLTAFLKQT